MFDRNEHAPKLKAKINSKLLVITAVLLTPIVGSAQQNSIGADHTVKLAIENNKELKANAIRINQSEQLVGSAFNIDKTQVYYGYDQNNIAENGLPLRVFGVSQSLKFPTIYGAQHKVEKQKVALAIQRYELNKRIVTKEALRSYYNVVFSQNLVDQYRSLDSLYRQFASAAKKRYEVGETNLLEKLTAETKQKEISISLAQAKEDVLKAYTILNQWVQSDSLIIVSENTLPRLALDKPNITNNPGILYYNSIKNLTKYTLSLERQKLLPDLQFSVFQGTNNGINTRNYNGFQMGIAIPLWFGFNKSKINAAKTETFIVANEFENFKIQLQTKYNSLISDLKKYQETVDYYVTTGRQLSLELKLTASKAFQNGEIDFLQYVQLLESSRNIEISYLHSLNKYNNTVLELNYLTN
jgi:cobalt-zinc-cadmium resistance protein CzcA